MKGHFVYEVKYPANNDFHSPRNFFQTHHHSSPSFLLYSSEDFVDIYMHILSLFDKITRHSVAKWYCKMRVKLDESLFLWWKCTWYDGCYSWANVIVMERKINRGEIKNLILSVKYTQLVFNTDAMESVGRVERISNNVAQSNWRHLVSRKMN